MTETFAKGDYVLATKYHDGDTGDQYAIGFYDHEMDYTPPRHHIVDSDGKQFRNNGFRRVEKITDAEGRWMIANGFENLPLSTVVETGVPDDPERLEGTVWDFLATCRAALANGPKQAASPEDV